MLVYDTVHMTPVAVGAEAYRLVEVAHDSLVGVGWPPPASFSCKEVTRWSSADQPAADTGVANQCITTTNASCSRADAVEHQLPELSECSEHGDQ